MFPCPSPKGTNDAKLYLNERGELLDRWGRLWGRRQMLAFDALPPDFATVLDRGDAVAGTPETVRKFIAHEIAETGINYYVCDFAFGTISHGDALRSAELFAKEVMPAFAN